MKIHINYAHHRYIPIQKLNTKTATSHGGFDISIPYGFKDLDENFINKYFNILSYPRGAGYWAWKPYLILKTLQTINNDDLLYYTDSGYYFVKNFVNFVSQQNEITDALNTKGIVTFAEAFTNGMYTKRDTFILMNVDEEKIRNKPQRMASTFLCKKTPLTISFLEEWLVYASDPRIITDMPNTQGLSNYPEFVDHRHDQSIMTFLTYKYDTYVWTKNDIMNHSNKIDPCLIACGDIPQASIENIKNNLNIEI